MDVHVLEQFWLGKVRMEASECHTLGSLPFILRNTCLYLATEIWEIGAKVLGGTLFNRHRAEGSHEKKKKPNLFLDYN